MSVKLEIRDIMIKNQSILKDVDLQLKNDVYLLVGSNGSGKTTLLNCIYRLHEYFGHVYINNVDVKAISINKLRIKVISYVNQKDIFFNHLTIKENVKLANNTQYQQITMEFKKYYGIDVDTKINELSGGQKQFLHVLTSLYRVADLYLFDEPFNNLDLEKQEYVKNKIMNLGKTVIIVDHNHVIDCNKIVINNRSCLLCT